MAVDPNLVRRGLQGRPGLRRQLAGLGAERASSVMGALSDIDPVREKARYRRNLEQVLGHERDARPIENRRLIENTLADPSKITSSQRDQLVDTLRRDGAGWGSVAAQRDPRRWGSIAQQRFGSLYRTR